jgi:tight adherence protein B
MAAAPPVLIAIAIATAFAAAAAAVLHGQGRAKSLRARMALVVSPYARVSHLADTGRQRARVAMPLAGLARRAGAVFAYDPIRSDVYPLRWWLVLPAALLTAWALAALFSNLLGPVVYGLVPACWIILSRAFFRACEQRRSQALYMQFPDALAMIVRSVRVGIPVTEGIAIVARESLPPTNVEFQRLASQISIGVPLVDAMREMALRNRLPEYRFFATSLALQSQTGGGLSEALENLADVIRKRLALRMRAHALAAEAKTSIGILAALPFVAGAGLAVLNPDYLAVLFTERSGQRVLSLALLSLGSGLLVMRGMIRRSVS